MVIRVTFTILKNRSGNRKKKPGDTSARREMRANKLLE